MIYISGIIYGKMPNSDYVKKYWNAQNREFLYYSFLITKHKIILDRCENRAFPQKIMHDFRIECSKSRYRKPIPGV